MKTGRFYGVGLGPGDPGLVTLRALEVLRSVQVIYTAASRQSGRSVSGAVIETQLRPPGRVEFHDGDRFPGASCKN